MFVAVSTQRQLPDWTLAVRGATHSDGRGELFLVPVVVSVVACIVDVVLLAVYASTAVEWVAVDVADMCHCTSHKHLTHRNACR